MSAAAHFHQQRSPGALLALVLMLCFGAPAQTSDLPAPLVTEGFINAPLAEVWSIFTTSEGYRKTGVAHAQVELRIGGEIRTHYDPKGRLGDPETIVNEILAYEPERMLAIRIRQAPASFQHRAAMAGTWTVLYFTPAGDAVTQVRIVGLGYDDSEASQAMRKFFAEGNRWTLDHIGKQYWPQCPRCKKEDEAEGG
jgi:uncharacterized protein YndB with AHSA1/START domain